MLKKFATWFIVLGLSFLVSITALSKLKEKRLEEQGKAFFYIHMLIIAIAIYAKCNEVLRMENDGAATGNASFFDVVVTSIIVIAFVFVFVFVVTEESAEFFDVDFYVTYQLISFGSCLCINSKNKNGD